MNFLKKINIFKFTFVFLALLSIYQIYNNWNNGWTINNIYFLISLLWTWLISELLLSTLLKVERSLIWAWITVFLWFLIFFFFDLYDITHYSNLATVFFAILWKNIFKKYDIHYINPLVLWIMTIYFVSLFPYFNFPYISWYSASSTINWFDIMLPISILFWIFITFKTLKVRFVASFFISMLLFYFLAADRSLDDLLFVIWNTTMYFYLFFMVMEPKTSRMSDTLQYTSWVFLALILTLLLSSHSSISYVLSIFIFNIFLFVNSKLSSNQISLELWTWTRYICMICGHIYDETLWDPDSGIEPGTRFEDIPDNWRCPICWVTKKDFVKVKESEIDTVFKMIVESREYINKSKNVIELVVNTQDKIEVMPGQFLQFEFSDRDWKFVRQYSVARKAENKLSFLIKFEDSGRAARQLRKVEVWDTLTYLWVAWKFILQDTDNPKVFIATGTWLSPVFNMILNTKWDKTLLFGCRNKDELFYEKELSETSSLTTHIFLSREENLPEDKVNLSYYKWRIDLECKALKFTKNTEFYICWNPWVVENTVKCLEERWFKNIYMEKFV